MSRWWRARDVLRRLLQAVGLICRCGSGGHPRRCRKHPWALRQHVMELNLDNLSEGLEEIERALAVLDERVVRLAHTLADVMRRQDS